MTELRDVERELDGFRARLLVAALFVLFCFGLLVARLVYLQVMPPRRAGHPGRGQPRRRWCPSCPTAA
jgi:hypothetical protein